MIRAVCATWRLVRARRHRGATLGVIALAVIVGVCLFTSVWTFGRAAGADGGSQAPRRYEHARLDRILLPPSWAPHAADEAERLRVAAATDGSPWHVLGTDRLGRDLLVRCLAGGAISLGIGLAAALLSVGIGTAYGAIAASAGGRIDAVMMRTVDILYGLPYVLLVVLIAVAADGVMERLEADAASAAPSALAAWALRHRGLLQIVVLFVAIGGVSWLTLARVIRGQVLSLREQPFMEAARAIGVPWRSQFIWHVLPNLVGPIVVYATLTVPQAILQESFLSFLGIGVQPPLPSWGNLAADGLGELNPIRSRWWLLLWPCALLAVTLLSLNLVGEGLREALDPKRRELRRAGSLAVRTPIVS
jgi:oligopeptide transport system permease protein